jgi:hypothetical protein
MATATVARPTFLTANVYFWSPAGSAAQRRRNEDNRHAEFTAWLESLGFTCVRRGDTTCAVHPDGRSADLVYRESVNHVYRTLQVYNAKGRRSNITILK